MVRVGSIPMRGTMASMSVSDKINSMINKKLTLNPILISGFTVSASEDTVTVNGMLNIPENRKNTTEKKQLSILREAFNMASNNGHKLIIPTQTHFNHNPMKVGEDGWNTIYCANCGEVIASYMPEATKDSPNWEWGIAAQCNEHECD
jgi:hypothetical protein